MNHKKHIHEKIRPGARVRFSAEHCRNTGQFFGDDAPTDSGPFAAGTMIDWHAELLKPFAVIEFDNGVTRAVHAANLWPVGIPEPA